MGTNPTDRIRERALALLAARPDVKDAEFGARIGRGYSWVSAFRKGTRPPTDVALVVRMAKYFGVSVGYLLGETDRALDPKAATLLATWRDLNGGNQDAVLILARQLQAAQHREQPSGEQSHVSHDAVRESADHTPPTKMQLPKRKRR